MGGYGGSQDRGRPLAYSHGMRTLAAVSAFVLLSAAAAARAQEAPATAPLDDEAQDEQAQPKRQIKVLDNPYEISSFYRSSQGGSAIDLGYEEGTGRGSAYPIAGFYRAGARGRYSMFWTNGYSRRGYGMGTLRGRGFFGGYRTRPLGLNGDLCLFAPTFLAPVGPLTGVFFER
jgi:opacity protein-like surface antigen